MKVLITGATGLIGQKIVRLCHDKNISVNYLTTSKSKLQSKENYQGYYWNPKENDIDHNCFKDVDAIIHLVGASIAKRWTKNYKKEIIDSRTVTTALLINTLKAHNYPLKHIVSASAIGFYPTSLTNYYKEDYKQVSDSFLGEVVQQWETAVDGFKTLDIKVTKIRIGIVLAEEDGALPKLIKPIEHGIGAVLGNGKQWQSWIHIEDLANIFLYAIENGLEGIYNGVAPNPVNHEKFTKLAAKVLKRPLVLPNIPKFVIKLILGEMHIILFESQRVSSEKIEAKGFQFKYNELEPSLEDLL